MDYYEEALRREPGDSRCNNAVGLLLMRKGQFAKAESYFQKAVETLTQRNPNPYDGEALYNLGLSLKMQGKPDEAYDYFFKATWNSAWQDAAFYTLAQIDTAKGNFEQALALIESSLLRNWHNHKARQLKASLLRKLVRNGDAAAWIDDSLAIDGFNIGCLFEKYLLTNNTDVLVRLKSIMRDSVHNYLEYALDFAMSGLYEEASDLMNISLEEQSQPYPMTFYALGYFANNQGNTEIAKKYYQKAESCLPDYCFPNRVEEVIVLQDAMTLNPEGARAYYYLGNFWYSRQQYKEAVEVWEKIGGNWTIRSPPFGEIFRWHITTNRTTVRKPGWHWKKHFFWTLPMLAFLMELDQLYKKTGVFLC